MREKLSDDVGFEVEVDALDWSQRRRAPFVDEVTGNDEDTVDIIRGALAVLWDSGEWGEGVPAFEGDDPRERERIRRLEASLDAAGAWAVPPRCQGQIVEVAYALDGESRIAWRRTFDSSDRTSRYAYADVTGLDLASVWDPHNRTPDGIDWIDAPVRAHEAI